MDLKDRLEEKNAQQQTGLVKSDRPKNVLDIFKGDDFKKSIMRAVPKHFNPERAIQLAIQLATDKKLKLCNPMTVLAGVMMGSTMGLEINTPLGQAYLIAYGDKATFQLGYQGILNLCYRSNEYKMIYAHEVDKADKFSYQYGLNKDLKHTPNDKPEGIITHYYAVYKTKNDGFDFIVMSMDAVKLHRDKFSKGAKKSDSSWATNFDSMAKKTVLIKVLKYAPKSIELARALAQDETAKEYQEGTDIMDVENMLDFSEAIDVDESPEQTENKETETPGAASEEQKKNDVKTPEVIEVEVIKEVEVIEDKTEADTIFDSIKEEAQDIVEEEIKEPVKLDTKRIQKIHIIIGEINKVYKLIGKPEIPEESYREHLLETYKVESSVFLTSEQADEFILALQKKKIKLETSPEAKEARAALYAAEQEAKKTPPKEKEPEIVEGDLPLIHEVFTDKPHKDFVGDARKEMLRLQAEADKAKAEKQVGLFSNDGIPDFMK